MKSASYLSGLNQLLYVVCYIVSFSSIRHCFFVKDRNIDFNNITVDTNWISFNALGFNITGDDQTFINMSQINSDPKHPTGAGRIISFNISASDGTLCVVNLSGLLPIHEYSLDNRTVGTTSAIYSDSAGTLQWNMSTGLFTAHHTWDFRLYSEFGANFNIQIRYENRTQGSVNLSRFGPHQLIIYSANKTQELNIYDDNAWGDIKLNATMGSVVDQLESGTLYFNLSILPYQMEFRWNNSETNSTRCYRTIVYTSGYNFTFWVLIDKLVYDAFYVPDLNDTLVKWTYNFIDNTGVFLNRGSLDTYAYIYTYTPNGTRMTVHSEYLDSYKKIYPLLLYGKKYYIGISCSQSMIDRIGFAPTETDTSKTTALYVIIDINTSSSTFLNYTIKSDWSAGASGLYAYYSDPSLSIVSSLVRVYDYDNGSLMYAESSTSSTKNYSFPGAYHNHNYTVYLQINGTNPTSSYVFSFFLTPALATKWSYAMVNTTLTTMFGYTAFRSYDNPSGKAMVPWADVLVFVVFCFLLFSIAGYNAPLSGLASGGWFVFAGAFISGSPAIFVTMGALILAMSFLYAWGDRK